jgi:hypothetical protein
MVRSADCDSANRLGFIDRTFVLGQDRFIDRTGLRAEASRTRHSRGRRPSSREGAPYHVHTEHQHVRERAGSARKAVEVPHRRSRGGRRIRRRTPDRCRAPRDVAGAAAKRRAAARGRAPHRQRRRDQCPAAGGGDRGRAHLRLRRDRAGGEVRRSRRGDGRHRPGGEAPGRDRPVPQRDGPRRGPDRPVRVGRARRGAADRDRARGRRDDPGADARLRRRAGGARRLAEHPRRPARVGLQGRRSRRRRAREYRRCDVGQVGVHRQPRRRHQA